MPAFQRRQLILQGRQHPGDGAQVADLAASLGVSHMTVRRDLAALTAAGLLTRVHGGAVAAEEEPSFGVTEVERREAKQAIGKAAAVLVEDGQTIMIDIGTTTLALAQQLRGRELTVITSSLAVLQELLGEPRIELVVLGGVVRRNYRSLVGVLAEDALRQVSADVAFLGTSECASPRPRGHGHDDGRGPDQARHDRGIAAPGPAGRRGEVRDGRHHPGLRARRTGGRSDRCRTHS